MRPGLLVVFFFQAEDGIRGADVTGVQTCALPIFPKLMADSALVCKGEVVEAADVTVVSDPRPPHRTATAIVHVDRCFKGERPASEIGRASCRERVARAGGAVVGQRNNTRRRKMCM